MVFAIFRNNMQLQVPTGLTKQPLQLDNIVEMVGDLHPLSWLQLVTHRVTLLVSIILIHSTRNMNFINKLVFTSASWRFLKDN